MLELTVYAEFDAFTDGGRDSVPCDAHVGSHLHTGHLPQAQNPPRHLLRCKTPYINQNWRHATKICTKVTASQ